MKKKKLLILSILFIFSITFLFCKSDSSSTTTATPTTGSQQMNSVLPQNLAVSSNTEKSSASRADVASYDYNSKVAKLQAVLSATKIEECAGAITLNPAQAPTDNCYGPEVYYSANHPDGTGSCSPTLPLDDPLSGIADCKFPVGDVGIWAGTSTSDGVTQACSVAKLNSLVRQASGYIDLGMGVGAMLVCSAKVKGKDLPALGEILTLTTEVGEAISAGNISLTVTSAKLTRRSTDTSTGRPVYLIDVTGTYTQQGSTANSFTLALKHVPENDENTQYSGLLTLETDIQDNSNQSKKAVASVRYGQTDSTLAYRMRTGDYCTNTSSFYASNGEVTPFGNTNGDQNNCQDQQKNGWIGNFNESIASVSTADGTGALAYGWQAGQGDGWLRVLNVETKSDGTGAAYFGFTQNVNAPNDPNQQRADGDLAIDGMWCNWSGPNNRITPIPALLQKQALAKGTSGYWTSSLDNIAFAPTNSCNALSGFKYGKDVTEYNASGISAFTNSLASISAGYVFTVPTVPVLAE